MKKNRKKIKQNKIPSSLQMYSGHISKRVVRGLVLAAVFYVVINIISTQFINPLYFSLMNEDRSAAVVFVHSLELSPWYKPFYSMLVTRYGPSFQETINQPLAQRNQKIRVYESLLSYNPKNPNLLYVLSLMYREAGDVRQADIYLRSAQTFDPSVGQEK